MTTVIYADVYFFVNLSMDFTALFVCSKIMHEKISLIRFLIASAIGGLYAVGSLFIEKYEILSALLSFAIPFLMCGIALGRWGKRRYFVGVALFWGVSFLMGGIISAVYMILNEYLIGRGVAIGGRLDMLYSDLPLWSLGILALVSAAASSLFTRITHKESKRVEKELVLKFDGQSIKIRGLYDSGNLLKEPISALPVIIICKRAAEALFGEQISRKLSDVDLLFFENKRIGRKMRMIPISTVSESTVVIGVMPDEVSISGCRVNAYIAIDKGGEDFDGCDAIIPAEL